MAKFELHDFYCLQCGSHLALPRKTGHQHSSFHRKKLYCYKCKEDCNHIEIKNFAELEEFKENFENGVYINECNQSLDYCRMSRQW